jgi:ribose/xylose/arabinose/galactoside ABC-type transport system permease subunit
MKLPSVELRRLRAATVNGPAAAGPGDPGRRRSALEPVIRSPYLSSAAAIVILSVVLLATGSDFLTLANGIAIIYTISLVALLAIGETMILISAGVDLSAGSMLGLSGTVGAWVVVSHHWPSGAGIVVCLAVGVLGGLVNGLCCAFTTISPFIVTLAVSSVATGLTLVISQGNTIAPLPGAFNWLGAATWGKVPYLFFMIIVLFIAAEFLMRRSVPGRELYALGGNPRAAIIAGISRRKLVIGVYTIAGLLYGVAGLAQVGILGAATTGAGADDLLTPIAAAVIGGVSLFGGEGSVVGAGLGIIVIGLINDGLGLRNISTFYTTIVYGVVVFLAVLGDSARRSAVRRRQA